MDKAFLRLKQTIEEARDVDAPNWIESIDYSFISILDSDTITQTTNTDFNIIFAGDFVVELVDLCGRLLQDITINTTIYQFTNSETGIKNITYTIKNIGVAYYGNPVMIKFTNTGSEAYSRPSYYYSTPFHIVKDIKGTVLFKYKSNTIYNGVDYENSNFYQSIRLKAYQSKLNDESQIDTYTDTSGNKKSKKTTKVLSYDYKSVNANPLNVDALVDMFDNGLVYLDNKRVTSDVAISTSEYLGSTSRIPCDFKINLNRSDIWKEKETLVNTFRLLKYNPSGSITVSPSAIQLYFNKSIILGSGTLRVYKSGFTNELIAQFTQADISVTNSLAEINITGLITIASDYYIIFTEGLIKSNIGENISVSSVTELRFNLVATGDYDSNDYSSTDYLT